MPLWLEVLDGNSSDKLCFHQTVQAYCRQLEGATPPWFVMDSAGYSAENLTAWQGVEWITRVPETLGQAKQILQAVVTEAMVDVGDGYRLFALCNTYAETRQRWLLVYSQQAYMRESKQLAQRVARAEETAGKAWRTLQQTTFQCEADAHAALAQLEKQLEWHRPQAQVVPRKKYTKPGRPAKDAVA